jgi:hypothetical protein
MVLRTGFLDDMLSPSSAAACFARLTRFNAWSVHCLTVSAIGRATESASRRLLVRSSCESSRVGQLRCVREFSASLSLPRNKEMTEWMFQPRAGPRGLSRRGGGRWEVAGGELG